MLKKYILMREEAKKPLKQAIDHWTYYAAAFQAEQAAEVEMDERAVEFVNDISREIRIKKVYVVGSRAGGTISM
ncbi:MAG: hypothetical protein QXE01_03550 [Sulfolobales archaeon]